MRAQQVATRKIERVMHGTRRVVVRDVQGREVVEIVFDFRTCTNAETGIPEDLFDTQHGSRNRMVTTNGCTAARERHIDRIGREPGLHRLCFKRVTPSIEGCLNVLFGFIDFLTGRRTFLGWQRPEGLQSRRDLAFFAKKGHPNRIQCGEVVRCIDVRRSLGNKVAQGSHGYEIEPAGTCPAGSVILAGGLLFETCLGGCSNRTKSFRIVDSDISQNLAINLDLSLIKAVDQAAV